MDIKTQYINNQWKEFILKNDNGMSVSILNYGGIITKISVPDKNGKVENVVIGYKNYDDYKKDPNYFGAIIGRVAGRVQDSSFTLEGETYKLDSNEGENHLHGGKHGLHQVIWEDNLCLENSCVSVQLSHKSLEQSGYYPGNLEFTVTYTLNNQNELILDYTALSDKTTVLTLTNHSYFNLSGDLKDLILNHVVKINSSKFVELDNNLIPTGNILNVDKTPFDFRNFAYLNDNLKDSTNQTRICKNGYDHYFILDQHSEDNDIVVKEENSGRTLAIKTNQPGVVMYTGNNLEKGQILSERESEKYLGMTFETQSCPASLHHEGFPSVLLKSGELYNRQTIFAFGIENKC